MAREIQIDGTIVEKKEGSDTRRTFVDLDSKGPGGKFTGKYIGIHPGQYGGSYDLEQADGSILSVRSERIKMLQQKMTHAPQGETLTITYLGRFDNGADDPNKFPYTVNVTIEDGPVDAPAPAAAAGSGFPF